MRVYRHIQFANGIDLPFADFKKTFAKHLVGLSESEVKECYKVVTKGNLKHKKDGKLPTTPTKNKKAKTSKGKD